MPLRPFPALTHLGRWHLPNDQGAKMQCKATASVFLILAGFALSALSAPPQMQAMVQTDTGLQLQTVDTPKPGPGQVLIRVYAAGVNLADGYGLQGIQIPGLDVAGVFDS